MIERESKSSRYLDASITVPDAAEMLGVSRQVMRRILDAGLIPFHRPLKHRRVRRGDVLAYRAQTTEGAVAEPAFSGGEDALRD